MVKLTRTVVVPSIVLTKRKWEILKELESVYGEMVKELVTYGFENGIKSFTRLKKCKYHELRRKYPQLPSHYVHVACQDASTRIKSFLKLKKKKLGFGHRVSNFIPTRCPWESSSSSLISSEISSDFSPIRGTPNSPHLALSPTSPLIDQGFGSSNPLMHGNIKKLRQQN